MEKELRIRTKSCKEEASEDLPVSPSGHYFNSSVLSLTILAVLETDAPVDDSRAMAVLRDTFLPINPRFSSIMVSGNNDDRKQWRRVEVNMDEHVIIPNIPPDLPLKCYDVYLDEYLTKLGGDPLPQTRPLWEVHIVKCPTSKAAGQIIFKLHHALGDGYSLMGALLSCLQRADEPSLPLTLPSFRTKQSLTSIPKVIYNTLRDFGWSILKTSVFEDDKTPIRSANKGLDHKPMQISAMDFSLDAIKHIKSELGVTINDAIASIIFQGVRLYMQGRSEKGASSHSTALVFMNTRSIDGYKSVSEMLSVNNNTRTTLWGNQFAFLHTSIPALAQNEEILDPLEFLFRVKRSIQKKRSSLAFKLIAQTLEITRKFFGPEASSRLIYKTISNVSLVISNLVGPIQKMAIANQSIKGLYFMVVGSPQSLQITVLSYMQTLRIGIGIEKNFIDMEELKSCIQKAFEMTFKAATKKQD